FLTELHWLDLSDNQIEGNIPVSNGSNPGLDLLVNTERFHFGKNQLSGEIPARLFHSNMTLTHLLVENNKFTGVIPDTLGFVQTMKMLDMSRNEFNTSDFPSWIPSLQSLTTLVMEKTGLQGSVPASLFSLHQLQTVILRNNKLNGSLEIESAHSNQLQLIDVQNNLIESFTQKPGYPFEIMLKGNPFCNKSGEGTETYCIETQQTGTDSTSLQNCLTIECRSNQVSSRACKCAFPYVGDLIFRAPSFLNLGNIATYETLEKSLMLFFQERQLPVESVSLHNPTIDSDDDYLVIHLQVFPSSQESFNATGVAGIGFVLSRQIFTPPSSFGLYVFSSDGYKYLAETSSGSKKSSSTGIIIGATVGGSVLAILALIIGIYAFRQKKRAEDAAKRIDPFASWDSNKHSGAVPQLTGARFFSFEELKKWTNNFSETNDIGCGGYGKVYRGTLPNGELVAIKRALQGSAQGAREFKSEIELLSRIHHKNVVGLAGFCFDRAEQMLVYEYIPNGTLKDGLSGKTGIRLDWMRRLNIAIGAARGLQYLHDLVSPPIIHRDIKSNNILLDANLNAKVADFGLSRFLGEKGHITTQVKGTMGYMDPEYYMTNQLTEKSDVFSFGVVLLEIVTGKVPIDKGRYIVKEVKDAMDMTKDLYNLHETLDPVVRSGATPRSLEEFVVLALKCVEEGGVNRPKMSEVVKQIENIMEIERLNPYADYASTSATYEGENKGLNHPYTESLFVYSEA
ncbi:probable leucine-rich repeat receptor-like protein kinase At5g49770, partial [Solanum tuberosum]|uniref:probable leucine-rich repeat receptor-like protein kinase At5g49770 n=1 Tax=Solanum tuberosum TaxID=4113 RepID=UPI0003D26E52